MMNTNRTTHCLSDAEQVVRRVAESVVQVGAAAIERHGRFFVALSGGATPRPLYRLLTQGGYRDQIDWSRVEWFWTDERTVPPDHPDSNYRMASEALLVPLGIETRRIHGMRADRPELDGSAQDYEREIADSFCVSRADRPPRFDLILLGMGDDGHTASLFPYTSALNANDRWVVANDIPPLNTRRMTMTYNLINRAEHIVFVVTGKDKASRLAEVLQGAYDPQRLPAQAVRSDSGTVEWFVDAASAIQLK